MTRLLIPALAALVLIVGEAAPTVERQPQVALARQRDQATPALARGGDRVAPAQMADSAVPAGYPQSFTCDQVRSFVNVHGRWKALAWAVEQGATVGQINAARRCLNQPSRQ